MEDLVLLEVLDDGAQVYVCNVCDNGFEDTIKRHIKNIIKNL